jgi:hypothetical protein
MRDFTMSSGAIIIRPSRIPVPEFTVARDGMRCASLVAAAAL